MTQEDKQLLFQDLCARLPYHVRVKVWLKYGTTEEGFLDLEHNYADVLQDAFYYDEIKDIKPYLRPMSSMTEEEVKELYILLFRVERLGFPDIYKGQNAISSLYDWLNINHFDYRGLIDKGLAIAVTQENNPYKE